jgi:hypothetical protein
MYELMIVVGLFALLGGVAALALFDITLLIVSGTTIAIFGFLMGVPTGVMYHLRLYQVLHPRNGLDEKWIWNPIAHNERLTEEERGRVMPWCYAGGIGFGFIVLGCLVAFGAALRGFVTGAGM